MGRQEPRGSLKVAHDLFGLRIVSILLAISLTISARVAPGFSPQHPFPSRMLRACDPGSFKLYHFPLIYLVAYEDACPLVFPRMSLTSPHHFVMPRHHVEELIPSFITYHTSQSGRLSASSSGARGFAQWAGDAELPKQRESHCL